MFRTVRTLVTLAGVAALVWGAFTVELGSKTFAEHIDSIGETREAKELIDGTRSTVHPALGEAKDRVLGEYVEAPTGPVHEATREQARAQGADERVEVVPARTAAPAAPADRRARPAAAADEPAKLPGRR